MSSLLNNASLLLNPAGSIISYQEDKIYSVLPKDGTGDFTFSGGDGGTRVNQDGYIEITPVNIFTYSNTFSDSSWAKSSISTTQGYADPFGGNNAWLFSDSGGSGFLYKNTVFSYPQVTLSVYVKYYTDTNSMIYIDNSGAKIMYFNPQTGVITSLPAGYTGSMEYVKDGWYRVSMTGPIDQYAGMGPFGGGTGTYYYGAQLNIGSTARPYQPTTDRLNYPRITYQNGRGALLQEPQRTNVTTNSQTISAGTGTTVSLDSGISPDGTQNADKLIEDTSTGTHITTFGGSLGGSVDSSTFCVSIFAKAAERTRFVIFDNNQGAGAAINVFDVSNGTKISGNGTIESYRDGWYRCIIFPSKTDNTTANIQIRLINTGTNDSYTGDGSSGMFFWGKQIEAGSFPTSYIPTTSATVTRPIDITLNTNASSVIGQTEGVLYADVMWDPLKTTSVDYLITHAYGASTANQLFLENFSNGFYFGVDFAGSRVVQLGPAFSNTTGRFKLAAAYKNNDFAFYVNGQQIGTDNAGSVPTCSNLRIGSFDSNLYSYSDKVNTTALFNTRLTNTQLAELTTVRSGSGGTISYYGPYTIHTFTGSATFTPSFNGEVEVLVVAGGGGGGGDNGGGGGAGGVLYVSSAGVSQGTGYTITVGAGGAGGTGSNGNGQRGASGNNSSAFGLTSIGGGGGGGGQSNTTQKDGGNGGSGGGGGGTYPNNNNGGAPGLGISGQGSNGGNPAVSPETGGGGGGAGGVGIQPSSGVTPDGGVGLPFSISGFSTFYAGGGAGGAWNGGALPNQGFGGLGGGGNGGYGASTTRPGVNGVNNLGGGGGGAGEASTGGTGGSGIVIVRYLT